MKVHRKFLLVVTLVAVAATPAVGQTTLPAAAASAATQGAAAIPDFSGIWAHLTWPDVEPPLSGPGPVKNLTRRNGVPDIYKLIGDYNNDSIHLKAGKPLFYWNVIISERLKVEAFGFSGSFLALALP